MIYLLTAVGLSPGGSGTVHIYTQTIRGTTQNKQYIEQHNNLGKCGPCPVLAIVIRNLEITRNTMQTTTIIKPYPRANRSSRNNEHVGTSSASGSHHLREIECVWNLMAHGDARDGKWRGNWRMEWVASTLTLPRNMVYPALLPLMSTPRLPAVDWTDASADLNGLVRFGERRNLVSTRLPSRFKRTIPARMHYFSNARSE